MGGHRGGLSRLADARSGRFTTCRQRADDPHGLPNNFVRCVLRDGAGRLWVSTGGDGLPQQEYNAGAACRGPGGALYFRGPAGLVGFRPAALRPPPAPPPAPPMLLTGLRRLNQPVALPNTAVGQRRLLRLGPQNYVFTLSFTALDLRGAGRQRLVYQLEGFDPDWAPGGPQREATYTNLDPGQYTFRMREADAPPGTGAALRLVVAPPW